MIVTVKVAFRFRPLRIVFNFSHRDEPGLPSSLQWRRQDLNLRSEQNGSYPILVVLAVLTPIVYTLSFLSRRLRLTGNIDLTSFLGPTQTTN